MTAVSGKGGLTTTVTLFATGPNSGGLPEYAVQETGGTSLVGLEVSPGIYIFSGQVYEYAIAKGFDPLGAQMVVKE